MLALQCSMHNFTLLSLGMVFLYSYFATLFNIVLKDEIQIVKFTKNWCIFKNVFGNVNDINGRCACRRVECIFKNIIIYYNGYLWAVFLKFYNNIVYLKSQL